MLKSLKLVVLFLSLSLLYLPASAMTDNPDAKVNTRKESSLTKDEFERASQKLLERAEQLKAAKNMATTREEKARIKEEIKDVKRETKALKQQALSSGVYIGAGALIVILLLILLVF